MDNSEQIKALLVKKELAEKAVKEASKSLQSINQQIAELACPYKVGEEIPLARPYRGSSRAIVKSITPSSWKFQDFYSLILVPLKKNGQQMDVEISDHDSFMYIK